jgi:hypothetical protein
MKQEYYVTIGSEEAFGYVLYQGKRKRDAGAIFKAAWQALIVGHGDAVVRLIGKDFERVLAVAKVNIRVPGMRRKRK